MTTPMHPKPALTRAGALRLALAGLAFVAACNSDKLLTVPTPDVVQPSDIAGTAALPSAYAAAISDFQVAYAGSGTSEGQVNMAGTLADELFNAETFPTRIEVDKRTTNPVNSTMLPIFRNLQRARHTAELVEARFAGSDPTNAQRAEVEALAGFTYVLFGENYCNGVPTSTVDGAGNFVYGQPQTNTQLWAIASQKFDSAIALATAAGTAGATSLNLARIGKGRVLLDQGQYAAAAAAVAAVPTTFVYNIQHDANTTRQNNGIFAFMYSVKRFTVGDKEGGNGLPFVSANDARVAAVRNGNGADGVTPEFQTLKAQDRASPTPLALGTEARLIEAEAALQANDDVTLLAKLNAARAAAKTYAVGLANSGTSPAPIAALPATTDGKVDLLFSERAFDLFLTSHRVGDLRRLIRQYGRGSETVFPTGAYPANKGGGQYGTDVNLPVPFEETNNPNFLKCIDRAA